VSVISDQADDGRDVCHGINTHEERDGGMRFVQSSPRTTHSTVTPLYSLHVPSS
jgi:hypothetical protein